MADAGYIWVQGTELRYIDGNKNTRGQTGTLAGGTGTPGYFWIESNYIHYIDSSGNERYLPTTSMSGLGTAGHVWLEASWIHYMKSSGGEAQWRQYFPHDDWDDDWNHTNEGVEIDWNDTIKEAHTDHNNDTHSDTNHGHTAAHDDHGNFPAINDHSDVLHGDHSDRPHTNFGGSGWILHTNIYFPLEHTHTAAHSDYSAAPWANWDDDSPHYDIPAHDDGVDIDWDDNYPHDNNHTDDTHSDTPSHNDHDNVAHVDEPHII